MRLRLPRPLWLVLCLLLCLVGLAYFPVAKILAAPDAAVVPSAGRPLVNLQSPRSLKMGYAGSPDLVDALHSGSAKPISMTAADFDSDGAEDLVTGYATSSGGIVSLLRGNPDAFAPKDQSLYPAAMRGKVPPTFMSKAVVFAVPESPDFMVTGDFNRDGYKDLLIGTNGGDLYLLAGDGRGSFGAPTLIPVPTQVRALAASEAGDVAVATDGGGSPLLSVLVPSQGGLTAMGTYTLPASATSIAWGNLGSGLRDVAAAAGNSVFFVYEATSADAQTETASLTFAAQALTLGNFIWDKNNRTEVAVLASDGNIHILQHGTLDTSPLTAADLQSRSKANYKERALLNRGPIPQTRTDAPTLGSWTEAKQLASGSSGSLGVSPHAVIQSPHLAAHNDLMVLDSASNQMRVFGATADSSSMQATVAFSSAPVATYVTKNKLNGKREVITLTSAQSAPIAFDAGDPPITVSTATDEDDAGACTNVTVGNTAGTIGATGADGHLSLREAVCEANNYFLNAGAGSVTINVPAGTYNLTSLNTGELQIGFNFLSSNTTLQNGVPNTNVSIVGAGSGSTIIKQTDNADRVFNIDYNTVGHVTVAMSGVEIAGGETEGGAGSPDHGNAGGGGILAGGPNDSLTLTNVLIDNNSAPKVPANINNPSANFGAGMDDYDGSLDVESSTIKNNTASAGAGGVAYGQAFTAGTVTFKNSTISGNTAATDTSAGAGGGGIFIGPTIGITTTINNLVLTGNAAAGNGGDKGGAIDNTGTLTIVDSRIAGNSSPSGSGIFQIGGDAGEKLVAINNWWGCNAGPSAAPCDTVVNGPSPVSVTYNPWLVLSITASPNKILKNQTSTLTADLAHNSANATGFTVPDGTPITFGGTLGTENPTATTLTSGTQTSTYTAGNSTGYATGTATVDAQTVSAPITIGEPPLITSANSVTFTTGINSSFTVTTTGFPPPALTEVGALPSGVTFVDNLNGTATLAGTPNAGTGGIYNLTFSAKNGFLPDASQIFTLTVHQPPAITSANNTAFEVGISGTFSVTTTGFPTAAISDGGASLPSGVTFVDNGDGTGTLSGIPAAGTGGTYSFTFTANNSVSPNATQNFTLTVDQPPAITSGNSVTLTEGTAGTFTVTTTGFPHPALTEVGSLPSGVTFVDNGNGTATLAGNPALFTADSSPYSLSFSAKNGFTPDASQSFTLTVLPETVQIMVGTSPAGLSFSVDTTNFTSTQTFTWKVGRSHTIATTSPQFPSAGTQNTFTSWSDGGAISHGVIAPSTATTYTATFSTQFLLTTSANPSSEGTVTPATGFQPAGSPVNLTASPNGGDMFVGWTSSPDTVANPTSASTTITMNGPETVTGNFAPIAVATTTALASSLNPSFTTPPNNSVTFTATVTVTGSGSPVTTGTVTFTEGANTLQAATAVNGSGQVTFTTTSLPEGDHTIVATYSGATGFQGSNGNVTQEVDNHTVVTGNQFCNPGPVTFPNTATSSVPYPSNIFVTGVTGNVSKVTVTLNGFTSTSPNAIDMLLVGPTGAKYVPFAQVGDTTAVSTPLTFVLDDAAASQFPNGSPITAGGSFRPSAFNASPIVFAAPAPASPKYAATFGTDTLASVFNGTNSTGKWQLFTQTSASGASGALNNGWCVTIIGHPSYQLTAPTTATAGTSFIITLTAQYPAGGATDTAYTGTVHFSSSDVGAGVALPSDYTFTSADQGTHQFSVTLKTPGPQTITAADTADSTITATAPVGVNQGPAITSANNTTFTVGTAGSFSVTTTGTPSPSIVENGSLPNGVSFLDNGNGTGTLSGTPTVSGTFPITFKAHNSTPPDATQNFTLTVDQAPAITSANSTTFTVGTAGTFTVTTTGFPAPSLIENGALPNGVGFVDNGDGTGTLSGTPTASGTFPITFTAHNSTAPDATQNFTLTVNQAPAITSANNTTFTVGTAGSFTVTTTGFPKPSIGEGGSLPNGVGFVDNGNGTGTLSGTPTVSGMFAITFTAHNSTAPDATQSFTLTVNQAPGITSANHATFVVGTAGSFTVTTTGFPKPSVIENGVLPNGVGFVDNGNGTGTLSGNPTVSGTFPITFTAHNSTAPDATQNFTLTVNQSPSITSANKATFTVGTAGSFMVTTKGFPTPSLSDGSATLPTGVTFHDNGNGTGTLSGTPAPGTGGTYGFTLTASNGVSPNATQSFTLTVNQAPAITSANNTTFTAGTAGSFTVTTTGFPPPSLIENGTLPTGVTFHDNGNGTGTLSGTTTAVNTYSITFTAHNSTAPDAVQSFTLTVKGPVLVISPKSLNFGDVQADTHVSKVITLTNTGSATLTIGKITISRSDDDNDADFTITTTCKNSLAAGKSCTITVSLFEQTEEMLNAIVSIPDNAPGSPQKIPVTGNVTEVRLGFNPTSLSFPPTTVGQSSTKAVTITNIGVDTLNLNGFSFTGANASDFTQTNNCPASLAAHAHCTVMVTITPGGTGSRVAGMLATANGGDTQQTLPLNGTGN
jgi:hypothetical protein